MASIPDGKPGITINITPKVDWSALHGELTQALLNELKHLVSVLLHKKCPVCE